MKCDKCNNDANFEIHFIDNNNKKTIRLCKDCYFKYISDIMPNMDLGEGDFKYFQEILSDLIGSIINTKSGKENKTEEDTTTKGEKKCSNCGTSLSEIISKGKFGCSQCYEDFKDEVKEILNQTQGDSKHKGKIPERYEGLIKIRDKIEEKEEILKDLIVNEDYENAAKIRDEIKELKIDLSEIDGEVNG
ncbi:hypothetical protein [Miniphocaeibacter halophilus]|uniref:UvrB/UvrC motif-containing protein n=1 Tax=Miniphocaeibacter halophilus TaxID=2931922 RepID=A0AC61MRB7_9FIRM|nr:hypothetical protein [Miniphocaeibacter halophilus]QQK08091.1 UvrB/UvrC motif-containing protein [Miniphocaeibacter halophilus]